MPVIFWWKAEISYWICFQ